jgi:hypothetical protein
MKTSHAIPLVAALLALLSACGSSDDSPPPTSALPSMTEGALLATVQGDSASVGMTFFNASGKGFVILSDDGDSSATVMHVADQTAGHRVPAGNGFVTLSLARSEALSLTPPTGATLAGDFLLLLDGKPVALSVDTGGRISPASTSTCKLSGQVDLSSHYGGARGLSLTLENCGTRTAGAYEGLLFVSAATPPAAWQAVVENGSSVIDVLAYR